MTTVVSMETEEEVGVRTERVLVFLPMWSMIKEDGIINTRVFIKKTHME